MIAPDKLALTLDKQEGCLKRLMDGLGLSLAKYAVPR